jgi:hypothetical protein
MESVTSQAECLREAKYLLWEMTDRFDRLNWEPEELTDAEAIRLINRHYQGGWRQFTEDCEGYYPPTQTASPPTP